MFIVSVTGPERETHAATNELVREYPDAIKSQIQPTCIAREPVNQMPAWRFELQRAMTSGRLIINDMGRSNCDEITDFARSVRAISSSYHPLVFSTQPSECTQINGHYSLERVKDLLFILK